MQISQEKVTDFVTISLKGRLDASTSKTVEDYLLKQIDGGERVLVIDLAGLDYISSVGLRVFMMAAKRLRGVQGKIVVCSLQTPIRQIFDIAGFQHVLPIFNDRETAVNGIR
jgi:anti-anti-sigma factor